MTDGGRHGMSHVGVLFALPVLAVVYSPVFVELGRTWWSHPYAGHGMFVPLLSAFFLWMDWARLRMVPRQGHWSGVAVVLLALGFLAWGTWAPSLIVQGLSLVMAIAGLLLWAWGLRWVRLAAFPIGFLVCMVPLPRPVVDAVTLHLQLFAAGFAGLALDALDIPFYLDGLVIQLPGVTLQVAEVCNGLRFLAGLVVMTIAFAHLSQRTRARQVLLSVAAVPVAILANAVRVAAIAAAVYHVGPQAVSGVIHHSIGKAVWGLTIVTLVVLGLMLQRTRRSAAPGPATHTGAMEQSR